MDIGRQSRRQRVVEAYGRDFIKKEKGGKKKQEKRNRDSRMSPLSNGSQEPGLNKRLAKFFQPSFSLSLK